ncbi:MAG: hypothetical protein ISS16_08285 [Ignavibacteria bacterium]|nr:hypothetical protein [Ignavibacteria bacterium]
MHFEEKIEPYIIIEKTNEDFNHWINQNFITNKLRLELQNSNLLIIPQKGFRDRDDLNFPVKTAEFLEYIKENSDDTLIPDICIEDEDYKELALHSEWIIIADIVIRYIVLPLYLGILSNYLFYRWKNKLKDKKIKFELNVVKENETLNLKYEGPADIFQELILKEINKKGNSNE